MGESQVLRSVVTEEVAFPLGYPGIGSLSIKFRLFSLIVLANRSLKRSSSAVVQALGN